MMNNAQIGNGACSLGSVTMPDSQNSDKLSDASVTRLTSSPPPAGISNGNDAHPDRRISVTEPELLNCTLTRENEASKMQSITGPDSNRTPNTPEKTSEKPIDAGRKDIRSLVINFYENHTKLVLTLMYGVTALVCFIAAAATMMLFWVGIGAFYIVVLLVLLFILHNTKK